MRINKFIAQASGLSRRAADVAIADGRVQVNGQGVSAGQQVGNSDTVTLDGKNLHAPETVTTILLNKPVGYVVSRSGQGSRTVYELLPQELYHLKPVGRLDKDSSGLLLLTSDGQLANELTHPSHSKTKVYEIEINKALQPLHHQMINDIGVDLEDGKSKLQLERLHEGNDHQWHVTMREGRNRQIRRTFSALGYTVTGLHRIQFGPYLLAGLGVGQYKEILSI